MTKLSFFKVFLPITRHSLHIYTKLILLAVFILFNSLIPESFYDITLIRIIIIGIPSYLIINIIFSYFRAVFIKLYIRKHNYKIDHNDNYTIGIKRLTLFFGNFLFVLVLFGLIGISITEFLTSIGLFAVAITLIFKDYINNFINGILIMFSKNIKLNEYVKIGEVKGRIKDINFASVEIHTEQGEVVHIPNNSVYTKEITNLSRNKNKSFKIENSIPIVDTKKLDLLRKSVFKALEKEGLKDKNYSFNLVKITKDTADLYIGINTSNYNYEFEQRIRNVIGEEMLKFSAKHKK
ncbi:MAG: mechanosensitive ion channel family protein [Candidatus Woesearchaeota archaeon]